VLPALKESGNSPPGSGHYRLRYALVAAQVAFSAILLTGGGVFARSLLKAYTIDLGFRSANLLTLNFSAPPPGASAARIEPLQQALLRELATLPGVQSAALADGPPLDPIHAHVQIQEPAGGAPLAVDRSRIGAGFLRTVGIALAAGREFSAGDGEAAARVAIVNQTLAARLWPGESALGRVLPIQERPGRTTGYQVIGVARDAKYSSVWEQPQPYLYIPLAQADNPGTCLLVRTAVPPEALIPAIRERWERLAPRIPLYDIRTEDERVNGLLAPQRMAAGILGAFALLAVALSAIGLYSAMAYAVVERRREIGIRMALGARPEAVVRQMLGRSLALAGSGLAAGALLSAALMRLIAAQVKEVSPYDPLTFAAVALLLAAVSVAATLIPARRAAAIDPHRALQCE
jgi:predicted permease